MRKTHYGFSLAEVLVTLAIVGVVASVTMVTLKIIRPNSEQVMLKKAYYLVGRNVAELINDDQLYSTTRNNRTSGFSDTRVAEFHGANYGSGVPGSADANQKFCNLFAAKLNVQTGIDCSKTVTKNRGSRMTGHFTTADGIVWIMPIGDFNRGNNVAMSSMFVDVNGDKKPNCFAKGASTYGTVSANEECADEMDTPDRFEIQLDRFAKLNVPDVLSQVYLKRSDNSKSYSEAVYAEAIANDIPESSIRTKKTSDILKDIAVKYGMNQNQNNGGSEPEENNEESNSEE